MNSLNIVEIEVSCLENVCRLPNVLLCENPIYHRITSLFWYVGRRCLRPELHGVNMGDMAVIVVPFCGYSCLSLCGVSPVYPQAFVTVFCIVLFVADFSFFIVFLLFYLL